MSALTPLFCVPHCSEIVLDILNEGRVEARILTADQAETMGYEDGHRSSHAEYKLYVDGFDSIDAIQNYVSDLVNCILTE